MRSKVLVAVSRRVPPNETSADDILLATAAARRDCADSAYEVVLEWLLAALESKVCDSFVAGCAPIRVVNGHLLLCVYKSCWE